jgi:hypothetical protein
MQTINLTGEYLQFRIVENGDLLTRVLEIIAIK